MLIRREKMVVYFFLIRRYTGERWTTDAPSYSQNCKYTMVHFFIQKGASPNTTKFPKSPLGCISMSYYSKWPMICNDSNALLEFGSFYNKPLWCTPTKEWFEILFWHCTDHNNSRWIDNNFFPPVTTSTQCTVSRYSNNNPSNSCCLAWHQCQRC